MIGLGALAALLCATPAFAQDKPLPQPASDVMPPVELTITMDGNKPVCSLAELRLPAETNVELRIVSEAAEAVTMTAPGQFEHARVLYADGDLVHVASEKGYTYTVKQNGKGILRIRTMGAGEQAYGCTSNLNREAPFEGKLILAPAPGCSARQLSVSHGWSPPNLAHGLR